MDVFGGGGERFGGEFECVPVTDFSEIEREVRGLGANLLMNKKFMLSGDDRGLERIRSEIIDAQGVALAIRDKKTGALIGFAAAKRSGSTGVLTQLRITESAHAKKNDIIEQLKRELRGKFSEISVEGAEGDGGIRASLKDAGIMEKHGDTGTTERPL